MDFNCYILFSEQLQKFYIGACQESLEERIKKHNNQFYGTSSYTAQVSDWELFLRIETDSFAHAIRLERKIKSMKSKVYIQNLKKYPELVQKIKDQTQ